MVSTVLGIYESVRTETVSALMKVAVNKRDLYMHHTHASGFIKTN